MAEDPALKMVKSMLRSVLLSSKEGVPLSIVQRDYKDVVGEFLPFKKLGFSTLEDFIVSLPDVVKVERKGGEYICRAVADTTTAHIQKLVSKQRSKKVKRPARRPRPGGWGDGGRFLAKRAGGGGPSKYNHHQTPSHHTPAHHHIKSPPAVPWGMRHGFPAHTTSKPHVPTHTTSKPYVSAYTTSKPHVPSKTLTPVTIHVGNSATGTRTVRVGTAGPTNLLTKAINAANSDRDTTRKSKPASSFEVPPRFRKKQEVTDFRISTPTRPRERTTFANIDDCERHISRLAKLVNNQLQFDTVSAGAGFVSSIVLQGIKFGSEDIYESSQEAEAAAAKVAIQRLELRSPTESRLPEIDWNDTSYGGPVYNLLKGGETKSSLSPAQEVAVKTKVKEILTSKSNGLWALRIPHEYKERYKEEPPSELLELIRKWTDIARVELAPNTDREIVYCVQDDTNKTKLEVSNVEETPEKWKETVTNSNGVKSTSKKTAVMDLYSLYEDTQVRQSDVNKNLTIPRQLLIQGYDEVTVYLTYIHNPGYFCVQREDSCVDSITEQLQTHCKVMRAPGPRQIEKGQLCAGLYSGDNQWTRAEVIQVKENDTVELLFVDFGNVETVPVDNVRWLSPDLVTEPVQAITCSLYGVVPLEGEEEWSKKSSLVFAEQVQERPLIAVPRVVCDDMIEVELYLKEEPAFSVSERLIQEGVVRGVARPEEEESEEDENLHPALLTLPEEKQWDVHVTYINSSTNSLMLRLVGEDYSDKLERYQAELQEVFRTAESDAEIEEGRVYVAYDDELYHRVRVLSIEGKKVLCLFLDHGDTDTLIPEQLQPMDPAVNRLLAYQVVEVCLYGVEEVATNITALNKLVDLALGRTCVAEVVDRDIPSVILYDTSAETDININEAILRAIDADGGGIDSGSSASSTPSRVLSPIPSSHDSQTSEGSRSRDLSPRPQDKTLGGGNVGMKIQDSSLSVQSNLSNSKVSDNSDNSGHGVNGVNGTKAESKSSYLPPPLPQTPPNSPCKRDFNEKTPDMARICDGVKNIEVDLNNTAVKHIADIQEDIPGNKSKLDSSVVSGSASEQKVDTLIKPGALRRPFGAADSDKDETGSVLVPFQIPPVGEYLDVSVPCNTHDPHNFVCIPFSEKEDLNHILIRMQQHFTPIPHPMNADDIVIGKVYAGYSSGIWCRVKTCKLVSDKLMTVYLVDIGEYNAILLTEIQPLPNIFKSLPMMAFNAKLGSIVPESGVWSEAAKYKFLELVQGRDLVSMVQGVDKESGVVDLTLIDTSDENHDVNIDVVLVRLGYAKWNTQTVQA